MKNKSINVLRIRIITVLVMIPILFLVTKLYIVQIVRGDQYVDRAQRQYVRPQSNVFDRGTITFVRDDDITLSAATLQTGYTVAINPSIMKHPEDTFNALSFVLDLDVEDYLAHAEKTDDPYEELVKRIPKKQADQIRELDLQGVTLVKERWRSYPGVTLASHLLGFMAYNDNGGYEGQYGLEYQYNEILKRNEDAIYANFFVELFSGFANISTDKDTKEGSLVTTIEPEVQAFVEQELSDVSVKWSSSKTGMIIMDPDTGAITSMALDPTFDLNDFSDVDSSAVFTNSLVESVYEMGSIVKPITMAIGLDTKVITPEATFNDKGKMTLDGWTFYNSDKLVRGEMTMQDVLNFSLNTGVAHVVQKTGKDAFREYMKKLLGEQTEIDLPFEAAPLVDNLDSPRDIEYANASFGQGIAVSPISITRALASLGNGGYLVKPHVVSEINYDVGFSKDVTPKEKVRIFSDKTSEDISRMLVTVVDDVLDGGDRSFKRHTVAAKTGTAQIAKPDGSGYYENRFLHTFFGYFPAYDPKFIIFLYTIEPQGAKYSSQTLTDPFMNTAKFLINYYNIPPDR